MTKKLADEIDILRRRMVEENECTLNQLDHFEKRMIAADAEEMRKLESIIATQNRNAIDKWHFLQTIAARIGYLPRPEAAPAGDDAFEIHARHRHVAPPHQQLRGVH